MARSDLNIRIGTDLSNLTKGLNGALKNLKRFGFKAESIGRDLTTRISLPLVALGVTAVKTFAQFDRLEKGLAALNGSAEGGAKSFNRLNKIVLDTRTTLDLKTAALGAQRLQGAGLSAAFAERTIKQLGIAATVSGSAIDDVGGVIRQFTQIVGKGKIEQEDLNTILDRMPALGAVIKKEFGTSTAEGIRATGISMELFVSRLVGAIETNESFQNVQGGLAKSFESFANAVQVGIRPLGEVIANTLNLEKNLERLGEFVTNAAQAFSDLNPNIQKFIVYTALAAAAVGPLTFGLGAAAKSLPLLISGFSLLAGPLGKLGGLAKLLSSSLGLLFTGGSIGRAILFTKVISGLKVALAVLTGPIGLIVAGVALLVGGFIAAYKNSGFFRLQLDRVAQALYPITEALKGLIQKILPDFSFSLSGLGKVFNVVFAVIAGGISFMVEGFIAIIDTVKLVAGAVSDIFAGDFKGAGDKFAKTLFNPVALAGTAKDAATAAATVFSQTLEGNNTSSAFGRKGSGPRDTSIAGGDGSELTGGGGGGGARKTPKALGQLDFGAVTELSKEARKEIGGFFNEFVIGSSNVDYLQSKLSGLEIKPIKGLDQAARAREIFAEMSNELRDNLGTAFEETDAKARFFGEGFDSLGEKIGLTQEALALAYEQGFLPTDEIVLKLTETLSGLESKQDSITAKFGEMASSLEALKGVSNTAFDAVAQAMSKGASAAKAFGSAVLSAVRDAIAAEIKLAVATQVASALKSVPFPFNVGLAAAAGAGASALFTSALGALNIPALASGGLTTGPALALIGEGKHQEMVLPLPKIDELIKKSGMAGGGGGPVEFYISGENLRGVLNHSNSSYNRSY